VVNWSLVANQYDHSRTNKPISQKQHFSTSLFTSHFSSGSGGFGGGGGFGGFGGGSFGGGGASGSW